MNRPGRLFSRHVLFAFILAIFAVFLIWPIGLTVSGAFIDPEGGFTTRYFFGDLGVFSDSNYRDGIRNSLTIAAGTTILCLLLALPLAALSTRYEFPGKALLSSLVMVPLILPPFVGAIGLRSLLGRYGALNALLVSIGLLPAEHPGIDFLGDDFIGGRFTGIVIAEALHLYPILFLNVTAAMANLDPALDEAAQGLGASRWTRFSRITLPLITPGVFAGATIVFIWSFTELGTPLMFDFHEVTPVQIFYGLQEVQTSPRPYALVVVMLGLAVGLYLFSKWLVGGKSYEMQGKASIASTSSRLNGLKGVGAMLAFFFVIGLAVLPHVGVVLSSFSVDGQWYRSILPTEWTSGHYANALTHNLAVGSIRNSLLYASIAMVLCITIGLAISYLNVRVKIKGGWLLDSLAMLPLAVPGLVMAFGFVAMSFHWPFPQLAEYFKSLDAPGLASLMQLRGQSPNPLLFLIVAYAIRRLPYVVRSASAGLQQTSGQLEEAALNLGATPMTAIRRIVVPLIMANLIAGGILAFSFAMLEVSDSIVLADKEQHYPITKAIYDMFLRLGDGPYIASAMGVWGMALLTVTLVGAGMMMGKKLGAIFRV
jgi:iron(III) transport system permease protein